MKPLFKKLNPREFEKTEKILSSIKIQARKSFEAELEEKLSLALQKETYSKNKFFMLHQFTSKKLLLVALPLALLIITLLQTDFVSAKFNQVVEAGKKLLFGEYQFSLESKQNIPGTFITFQSLLEKNNIDAEAKELLEKNKKAIEKFIDLGENTTEILVRDDKFTEELYILLLDQNKEPIRGGIINKYIQDPNYNPTISALDSLCEVLEYRSAKITTSTEYFEYSNPNWGLSYTFPNVYNLEPGQVCGGGGGFHGSVLSASTQFGQVSDTSTPSLDGIIMIDVTFPNEEIPEEILQKSQKITITGNDAYTYEESTLTRDLTKVVLIQKNGFLYTFQYISPPSQKSIYDKILSEVLDSVKISEPLVLSNYQVESAFLKLTNTNDIYELKGESWEKRKEIVENTYTESDKGSFEKQKREIESPYTEEKVDLPFQLILPTKKLFINQYFGLTHKGLDIKGEVGDPIFAVADGTVIASQCGWNDGKGCYIRLDHGNTIETTYAHADELLLQNGDSVKAGQIIAKVGATGHATGPHLHFDIQIKGVYTNPLLYFPQ